VVGELRQLSSFSYEEFNFAHFSSISRCSGELDASSYKLQYTGGMATRRY
jgi:hypothetical protein